MSRFALCGSIVVCVAIGALQKSNMSASSHIPAHLEVDDSVGDLLNHPAFTGFGRLLLPWDGRSYDLKMPLRNIGSLLPYHTHVDPAVVVSSLNQMIDDASAGKTIFYDIYTERGRAWSDNGRLFVVGQLRGRADGLKHRVSWHRPFWRSQPANALLRHPSLHGAFGRRPLGAANVCGRG
jgi:hypothetical protein